MKRWLFVAGNNDLVGEEPVKNNYYSEFVSRLGSVVKGFGFEIIDLTPEATQFNSGIWLKQPFAFLGFNDAYFKADNNGTNAAEWKNYQLESILNVLSHLECLPGLVAVFLAGFGADTIKNLLTQRQ